MSRTKSTSISLRTADPHLRGRRGSTVIGDIVKDTAIFRAHKAAPVVIADEGETRFDAYAEDVFHVPGVPSHLAPILNTLAGHLWGYHAALAINNGSLFLHQFRERSQTHRRTYARDGLDVYEVVLEKLPRKIAAFYTEFRKRLSSGRLPSTITPRRRSAAAAQIPGRPPAGFGFRIRLRQKGHGTEHAEQPLRIAGAESINGMSRPVDAIKHQAKTVTVGTSRISEKIEGLLFDALEGTASASTS
jgi:glutamine---fructose-6-phosphate transaminase (isomerizing)